MTLTSSIKTVCYCTVRIRPSSSFSVEFRNSFLRTCGLVLIQFTIKCWAWSAIMCILTPVRDVTQHLINMWNGLSQSTVDSAVDEWRKTHRPVWIKEKIFWTLAVILGLEYRLVLAALWDRVCYYIFVLWFLLLLSFFLSIFFHCLFSTVADWMSTILPHMM